MKIVADDKIPFLKGVFESVNADVIYVEGNKISRDLLRNVDALLVRTRTRCNRELLEGTTVQFVGSATIGTDHMDLDFLHQAGIHAVNAPGCNADSVAQFVASALVNFAPGNDFSQLNFGVVGVGNVGRKVAATAEKLGCKVFKNDPPRAEREGSNDFVSLMEIAECCDIVSVHVPLLRGTAHPTFHLFDDDFFTAFRGKLFLSAGRGEAVDTQALIKAIRNGLGAVIDVWENEPAIDRELLRLVRCGTPHIAGYSLDGKANGTGQVVRQLANFFHIDELISFRPENLQQPQNPVIDLADCTNSQEALVQAINASYDLRQDGERLSKAPDAFESLRGNYPLRREFPSFTLRNVPPAATRQLSLLGFQLES